MDALSELLRSVKLSGAMFFVAELSKPWRVITPSARQLGRYVAPEASHVIEFHLAVEGGGWVKVGDETTPFTAGDLFMIPHGDVHEMGHGTGAPLVSVDDRLPELLTGRLLRSRVGGGGELTRMICGYFAGSGLIRTALAGLPRVVLVRLRNDEAGQWLERSIVHALERLTAGGPGSEVILARLAEALFVEALQRYLTQLPPGRTGWLAGVRDPAISRCLAAMHRRPAHPWTLDELANEAALSRSALTERFVRYLGAPPMSYLTQWRLELAAEELRSTGRTVVQIASGVGYESEAAFNRAFKRRFGRPPADYRTWARSERSSQSVSPTTGDSTVAAQPA